MRWVATTAMGTYGDAPWAAARLHGGPMLGADDLVQLYGLVRARDNPRRLDACFVRAARLHARGRTRPVPCTILLPHEIELYEDFVTSGPHAHSLGWWGWLTPWRDVPAARAPSDQASSRETHSRQRERD